MMEKYSTCKLLRAKRAEFFGEKLALVLLICCILQTFSLKYREQEIKDYQLKFQGRSPKFKDFSRTNSFSRTFQGKPKIQGLFKDCGNHVEMDWACAAITTRKQCKNSTNMDTGGKEKARKAKGDVEKNCGKREETSGIQVVELRRYESEGQHRVERTYPWPDSPHGETELSKSITSQYQQLRTPYISIGPLNYTVSIGPMVQ